MMPTYKNLRVLADLRNEAKLSQSEAAKRFELGKRGYQTFATWENGDVTPREHQRRRDFIYYLWDTLGLRRNQKEFESVWRILVQEWRWKPLNEEEKRRLRTGARWIPSLSTMSFPAPPGYQMIEKIGEGTFGVVYKARRTETGKIVAIKFLKDVRDQRSRLRFHREFHQLKQLQHRNIVQVDEYDDTFEPPYFVMEFIAGLSLDEYVTQFPERRLSATQTIFIVAQITEALAYLHVQGPVHRDVNSKNVMVLRESLAADQLQVKLMDFGLIRPHLPNEYLTQAGGILGNLPYTSPEQLRDARDVDPRSDLFSLGVIFYELMSGCLPFTASNLVDLVNQHANSVPPPSQQGANITPEIEAVVMRLLNKNPDDRYPSAVALLIDLDKLSEEPLLDHFDRLVASPTRLFQSPLRGRTVQLEQLLAMHDKAIQGVSQMALIYGDTGVGKTRMLEELHKHVALQEITFLQTETPRKELALATVLDLVNKTIKLWEQSGEPLPAEFEPLKHLPSRLVDGADLDTAPIMPGLARTVLFELICQFVRYIANKRPLIIAIDNLHLADSDTLVLLSLLLDKLERLPAPIFVCATYNRDEVIPGGDFAKTLHEISNVRFVNSVELLPLSRAETAALITGMLGHPLPALASSLFEETEGNPFLIDSWLRSLVGNQELTRTMGAWSWKAIELRRQASESSMSKIQFVIEQRLAQLGENSRRLLRIAALLGKQFSFDLLLAVSRTAEERLRELSEDQLFDATDEWLNRRLIEEKAGLFMFRHKVIQGLAQQGVTGERRKRLHWRIAEAIEQQFKNTPAKLDEYAEAIADHFRAAGQHKDAMAYAVRAARYNHDRYGYQKVLQILGKAEVDITPETDIHARFDLYDLVGEAAQGLGWTDKALEAFSKGYALYTPDENTIPKHLVADIAQKIGRQYGWKGEAQALQWMNLSRSLLDAFDSSEERLVLALIDVHMASVHYQKGEYRHTEALCKRALEMLANTSNDDAQGEGYALLGAAQDAMGKTDEAYTSYQISIEIWERLGNKHKVNQSENNFATLLLLTGEWIEAQTIFERILGFFEEIGDEKRQAVTLTNLGIIGYNRGQYVKARDYHLQALALFEKLGIPLYQSLVQVNLAWVCIAEGSWNHAQSLAKKSIQIEEEHELGHSIAEANRVLAQVAIEQGNLPLALERAHQALKLAQDKEDKLEEGAAEREIGHALRNLHQLTDAEQHLKQSAVIMAELQNHFELARTQRQLIWLYQELNDVQQAFDYFCKALTIFLTLGALGEAQTLQKDERVIFHLQQELEDAVQTCLVVMHENGWHNQAQIPINSTIVHLIFEIKPDDLSISFELKNDQPTITTIRIMD